MVHEDVHCLVTSLPGGVRGEVYLHVYVRYEDIRVVQLEVTNSSAVVALQVCLDDVGGGGGDSQDVRQFHTRHWGACNVMYNVMKYIM